MVDVEIALPEMFFDQRLWVYKIFGEIGLIKILITLTLMLNANSAWAEWFLFGGDVKNAMKLGNDLFYL